MLDRLKELLSTKYKLQDTKGVFLSAFDANNTLLTSNGVLTTDKPLETVLDMIYNGLIASHKETTSIICDIIGEISTKTSMEDIMHTDMSTYGICASTIDHTKSGVVLPNTLGINTASDALGYIKQKNNLSGSITIYTFPTDRFIIK